MNIKNLILVIGFSIISACASNEASMDVDESNAEVAKDEPVAAMEESKTEEPVMKEEAPAEEVTEVAETTETEVTTSDSDNLVSTCTSGGQVRIITVVYDNVDTDTVCEVTYEKSTGVQTLWTANSDRDYCLDRATEFVQKQEDWGWTCSKLK